jgi:hypothetical protein
MSTAAPPPTHQPAPGPLAPPDERFWERYSPHYEFPLSSIGSIAMHIGALAIFLGLLWLLARMTISDKTAVPMRAMTVVGEGDGPDGKGTGGGTPMENTDPFKLPMDPMKPVPEVDLARIKDVAPYFPKLPSPDDSLRPENLPTAQAINKLNDDLRKALLDGMSGRKGKGPGDGTGSSGVPGAGSSNTGDATSSSNRAVRWELIFKTENGRDYLNQLAAMKATLVIPNPPDFKSSKEYTDLSSAVGRAFTMDEKPGLYFVDDDGGSAGKLARALGLDFGPPYFIAFFPKDIEEELASKERAYRGRKENEIFSTKFKILIRDGRPSITVVDQVPVKR